MFSVVIPLYNKEVSIRDTIQSVLNQTFQDFEIIVINDGSTDRSLDIVRAIKDYRIRVIDKPNGGVSSARNRGIDEAKREWIAFLDGDDLWSSDHLYTIDKMIKNFPIDRVFCTSYIRSTQSVPEEQNESIDVIENYFVKAMNGHFFWTSVAVIHREVFYKLGGFDETLSRGEDLELWARIGRVYRFIRSNLVTAIYRIDAENRSNQFFDLEKTRVYRYNFEYSRSTAEYHYYRHQVTNTLIGLLYRRDLKTFFKLKKRHKGHITYLDILKRLKRK